MKSQKFSAVFVFAVFIGIVVGLVIASNFDLTLRSLASDKDISADEARPVVLGSDEPMPEELVSLQELSKGFAKVAQMVSPTVVTINSQAIVKRRMHPFFDDEWLRQFFNFEIPEQEQILRGLGSGVIVNPDGYILTNNHVIKDADEITVSIDGEEYEAEIVGKDPESDLAVIKIDKKNLPTIKLGNSDELQVGEWVLAIGNPFSEVLQSTVTAGIVSAKGRKLNDLGGGRIRYQDFIQTDAAINPGNSGGALVNLKGELVGINTAIVGQANVGIGFAIPINLARNIMEQLIAEGRVVRGYLGVLIGDVDEDMAKFYGLDEHKGAIVSQVVPDGPADRGGIKEEDIILKINDTEIRDADHLTNTVATIPPGTKVKVTVWRDGKEKVLTVELGERPQEGLASAEEPKKKIENQLGIEVHDLTPELARRYGYEGDEGVLIVNVRRNSIAAREGLRAGLLITAVNRKPVRNVRDFNRIMKELEPGDIVLFRLKFRDSSFFRALRIPKEKKK